MSEAPLLPREFPDEETVLREAWPIRYSQPDRSEAILRRGLEQFPESVALADHYALFLRRVRADYDAAETLFEKILAKHGEHPLVLGDYAGFKWQIREDIDCAEALFERALAAKPDHNNNLANFAHFKYHARHDADAAEALYRRAAATTGPFQAVNLCRHAVFCVRVRRDYYGAKALYRRAFTLKPKDAEVLGMYAQFLDCHGRRKSGERLLRRAVQLAPDNAHLLVALAENVYWSRKDRSEAKSLFERAIQAMPGEPQHYGRYAEYLFHYFFEDKAAVAMVRRALALHPDSTMETLCLAQFLLALGDAEGESTLLRARELLNRGPNAPLSLVAALLRYLHGLSEEQPATLFAIRAALTAGTRCPGWQFSRNIAMARRQGHAAEHWLFTLTDVATSKAPLDNLSPWPTWTSTPAAVIQ